MRFLSFMGTFIASWRDYPADVGTVLGNRYEVQQLLGEGSYGLTYKCKDQTTGKPVAVKQARPSKGAFARQLLEREAIHLQALEHPNLPAYHEIFTEGRHTYLVMSFFSGHSFEELIFEQGAIFKEQECVLITLQLLRLVSYIHAQGVVHLDLRIPNVLIEEDQLFIIDFGLARQIGEPLPTLKPDRKWFNRSYKSSSCLKNTDIQADLSELGHLMLFLLYSSYEPDRRHSKDKGESRDQSWQVELNLSPQLQAIIERLLGLQAPYSDLLHFQQDLKNYGETIASVVISD